MIKSLQELILLHSGYLIAASAIAIALLLTWAIRALNRRGHPLAISLRATRNWILPTAVLLYFCLLVLAIPLEHRIIKIVQTFLWVEFIWVLLSLLKVLLFDKNKGSEHWRARMPGLLVDMARLAMVIVGASIVVAEVWDRDLGTFITTLGVGSLVLGLALQDTLGSLMAGIAILIERPFGVGDWIKVGDNLGVVTEMNWRAVHLYTRDRDFVIVPNSVIGKDRILNYSRPDPVHGTLVYVNFSYDDPPNKVKHVLLRTVLETRDVLANPEPRIRTKKYEDFSIQYEIRFFTSRFDILPEIESDFMTKIWYAARRNNLNIPYPVRTVYKTEVPLKPPADPIELRRAAIKAVPLFSALSEEELENLARDAAMQNFARGESVVHQGEPGDALYIVVSGKGGVFIQNEKGQQIEVAQFGKHDFFGEMSLLSGEPRSASVRVKEDMELVVVYKDAFATILERRPDLTHQLAAIMAERNEILAAAKEGEACEGAKILVPEERQGVILAKIKNFFKL